MPPVIPLIIPPRYGSLIPAGEKNDVEVLTRRSASASTTFSAISNSTSTFEFLDAKIESLSADLALNTKMKQIFNDARKRKDMTEEEYRDAVDEVGTEIENRERELVTIKRQKKTIADDLDEMRPEYSEIGAAYADILTTKIMSASKKGGRKRKRFYQTSYTRGVLDYYGAKRNIDDGTIEKYCHLSGWLPEKQVKCAHLVPKILESDELSYLFGVREIVLSEPRNGITLYHTIEEGLDNGWIVFVPDKPVPGHGQDTAWRCILVEQSKASHTIYPSTRWKDIDGKELKFLTSNRPARRYLYLRFVITCLHQRKIGNTEWLEQALAKVHAKGYIWATPGPYLRKSMLITLARRVSDNFLPEAFYGVTFNDTDGCPGRSPEAEDDLAMSFDIKIGDAYAEAAQGSEEESSEEGSGSGSGFDDDEED